MHFKDVYIIGGGTIANTLAKFLKTKALNLTFIEYKSTAAISSASYCEANSIHYETFDKEDLTFFLKSVTKPTLVLSASNRYIFPENIISNPELLIVNFHASYLPEYPGRNTECWAIFEESDYGGVTWHKVVAKVDKGDILIQKKVPITPITTSFSLLRTYMTEAYQTFVQVSDFLLCGDAVFHPQELTTGYTFRFAKLIPNGGQLDINWTGKKISAFLRAMDYGPLQTLGIPKIYYKGQEFEINKYQIESTVSNEDFFIHKEDQAEIWIKRNNLLIKLLKLQQLKHV